MAIGLATWLSVPLPLETHNGDAGDTGARYARHPLPAFTPIPVAPTARYVRAWASLSSQERACRSPRIPGGLPYSFHWLFPSPSQPREILPAAVRMRTHFSDSSLPGPCSLVSPLEGRLRSVWRFPKVYVGLWIARYLPCAIRFLATSSKVSRQPDSRRQRPRGQIRPISPLLKREVAHGLVIFSQASIQDCLRSYPRLGNYGTESD